MDEKTVDGHALEQAHDALYAEDPSHIAQRREEDMMDRHRGRLQGGREAQRTLKQQRERPLLTQPLNTTYKCISTISIFALQCYYRNVYVSGIENVPSTTGCIFAANHWNNAVDIGSLLAAAPRKLHFWSKQELFKGPQWTKDFLLAMGCLPVQRNTGKSGSNDALFVLTQKTLQDGGIIAIFPEGTSHNEPELNVLKDGCSFASLQYASSMTDPTDLVPIIPVGVTYEPRKYLWRQNVHVRYGKPISIVEYLPEYEKDKKTAAKKLTAHIRRSLRELTIDAGSFEYLKAATAVQKIVLGYRTASKDIKLLNNLCKLIKGASPAVQEGLDILKQYQTTLKLAKVQDHDIELLKIDGVKNLKSLQISSTIKTAISSLAIAFFYLFHLPAVWYVLRADANEKYKEVKAQTQIFAAPVGLIMTYALWYIALTRVYHPYILHTSATWSNTFIYLVILLFISYTFPVVQDWWSDNFKQYQSLKRVGSLQGSKTDFATILKLRKEVRGQWLQLLSTNPSTPATNEPKKEE